MKLKSIYHSSFRAVRKISPTSFISHKLILSLLCLGLFSLSPQITAQGDNGGVAVGSSKILSRIVKRGTLIVGMQKDYQPFHISSPRPKYPGIDVEIARKLAESLGVKLQIKYMKLGGLLSAASAGTVDLSLGGISSSLSRARRVNFTLPYVITTPAGLLSKSVLPPESDSVDFPRRSFKSLRDLRFLGKLAIGVKQGTTNEKVLQKSPEFKKHKIKTYTDRKKLLKALRKGKIDVLVGDGTYIRSLILKKGYLRGNFIPLTNTYRPEHLSIALPRGDAEYWNYLNFFVKEIKRSGYMSRLVKKYFNSSKWIK